MLQRLATGLLTVATRRWPSHLRETVAREWAAELRTLAEEPGVSGPVRACRQMRFASSLALSRPPSGDPVVVGRMRWLPSSWSHVALLVSAPLLTMVAALVALVPLQLIPFGYVTLTPTSTAWMTAESYLVLTFVALTIGTSLGRRLLLRQGGLPASPAQCAWATLPVIAGLLMLDVLARGAGQIWSHAWLAVVAALCLALLVPALASGAAALSFRGQRGLALTGTVLLGPILTAAVMYVVMKSASSSVASPEQLLARLGQDPMLPVSYFGRGDRSPVEMILAVLPGYLLATIVVSLAHAIRMSRPLPSVAAAAFPAVPSVVPRRSSVPVGATAPGLWWHRSLLGGAALSVILWAVTLTYLTPNIGVQNSWTSRTADPSQPPLPALPAGWPEWTTEEGRLWMQELQLLSIACAVLCFLGAMAHRRRPLLPALAGSAILVAANMAIVRAHWTIPRLLPYLAAGGLLLGAAVWWLSSRLRGEARSRRLIITVTVLAAVLVPGSFFPRVYALGKQAPPVLVLVAVGLPTVLTMLIFIGVRASAARKSPTLDRMRLIGPLVVGVFGVLYYQDGLIRFPSGGENPLIYLLFILPLALSVPAAAGAVAAIRGREALPRRLWHRLLLIPALLGAGYAFTIGAMVASLAISWLVLFPMEYGQAYDGVSVVPGSVAIGLLFAFLTGISLDSARPGPPPAPAPVADVMDGRHRLGEAPG